MRIRDVVPVFGLLLLAASGGCGREEEPLSLETVLAHHTEALGGRQALEAVRSIEVEATIVEPEFTVDIHYRAERPALARVDVSVQDRVVYREGYDGTTAWEQPGDGEPVRVPGESAAAALRRGALHNLYGVHELPALGHRLELLEPQEIGGIVYHVILATYDDGQEKYHYLDPDTYLIARTRKIAALHPEMDPEERWTEDRLADYREVDGIRRSFESTVVDLKTDEVVQRTTVHRVATNLEIDPALFFPPES